jgi:hypothetical protein
MAIRLFTSSENTRGLKGSNNEKSTITPHRGSMVMVRQTRKGNNRELGQTRQAIHRQFQINIQKASINGGAQSMHAKYGETIRSYIQRWSIIKNSAEDVSDKRAINAFTQGLHRTDFVEEMG